MKNKPIKVGMKPSHPGTFIRTEIIDELDLSVTEAANVLGVRRATLSDLLNEKAALSPKWPYGWKRHSTSIWTCSYECRRGTMPTQCDGKHERSKWRRMYLESQPSGDGTRSGLGAQTGIRSIKFLACKTESSESGEASYPSQPCSEHSR